MSLSQNQKEVDEWASKFDPKYWLPLEMLARLTEETGELAREINHVYGAKRKKLDESENSIGKELIDILFTVCCIANREKIDLQKEWDIMIREKMYGRDLNRFKKNEESL